MRGSGTPGSLDVQGQIAIYSVGSSVNARIGSAGVVYGNSPYASKGTLVFLPLARVTAAVS